MNELQAQNAPAPDTQHQGFVARRIQLSHTAPTDQTFDQTPVDILLTPIIKAADIATTQQARDALEHAQQACARMHTEAEHALNALRHQAIQDASAQVFADANHLLEHWKQQEQQQLAALLPQLTALLSSALTTLCIEQPDSARLHMLLQQLIAQRAQQTKAQLYCHPQHAAALHDALAAQQITHWAITPDSTLSDDQLRLTDEQGDFHVGLSASVAAITTALTSTINTNASPHQTHQPLYK